MKRPSTGTQSVRVQPPAREVREEVRRNLESFGFTVVRVSPLSILVEAPVEKFENVFHTHALRQGAKKLYQFPRNHLAWKTEPVIPASLRETAEHILLPEPAELH